MQRLMRKKGIAKALQWYFMKSNKNTKALALTQAYIWACGHGANKQNTVYQAGKNVQKRVFTERCKEVL